MKTWEKILNGEKNHSNIIREEIETLAASSEKMRSEMVDAESLMEGLHTNLVAEGKGAIEAVRTATRLISEKRGMIAAILKITKQLQEKLAAALLDEQKNRLAEIVSETKVIDDQAAAKRTELVKAYAGACSLYTELTGQEPHSLSYDYFVRYGLDRPLQDRIKEIEPHGVSLHRARQALSMESEQLRKLST